MKDEELVKQELQRSKFEQTSTEGRLRNLENAIKGQVMANTSFDKRLESLEHHTAIDRDRITISEKIPDNLPAWADRAMAEGNFFETAVNRTQWIDAKDTPPVEDTNGQPIWVTIQKNGFSSVELVVYEEGMGWSITDDNRGELVRCEVVGEITHWMPQFRPLYPAT